MEYFKLLIENPEAAVQLIAAITTTIVTLCSLIIKFFPKAKTKTGKKIRKQINILALNKPEVEGEK